MFTFIKNMFNRTPTPTPPVETGLDEEVQVPGITFTISADGKVDAFAFWPKPDPKDDAQFELVVTRLGQLIYALAEGRLYPIMQQAIGANTDCDGNDVVAQRVLHLLNQSMTMKQRDKFASGRPCIPPTSAFDPRPDGVPLN